jgi:uncharacterized protein involved in response to NO
MTASRSFISPFGFIFVALLVFAFGWVALQVVPNDHAIERHGALAEEAANCINDNGVAFSMQNPTSNRVAEVCNEPGTSKWFIVIVCAVTGAVITCFKKDKLKRREQVERYLSNGGYQ